VENQLSSDLDLFRLGRRNIVRRIKDLERKVRRKPAIGAVTSTANKTITGQTLARTDDAKTLSFYEDNSPMTLPSRPNLIKNGSFEFFQLGETPTIAYGWTLAEVYEPIGQALDGNACVLVSAGTTIAQSGSHLANYPAGSWVLSAWMKNVGAVTASLLLEVSNGTDLSTGVYYRVDLQGNEINTDELPADGAWYRFYTQMVTTTYGEPYITIAANTGTVLIDCIQYEYEQGATTYLSPTTWQPDPFASPTIVRELRADNIIAGTLKVGGSDSSNPVIEAYDGSDVLVARLGAPSGGYRGLEVFGAAGVKVQSGGSIEAGATTIANDGVRMEVDDNFASERAVEFVDGSANKVGGLYGSAGVTGGSYPYRTFRLSSNIDDPDATAVVNFVSSKNPTNLFTLLETGVVTAEAGNTTNAVTEYILDSTDDYCIVKTEIAPDVTNPLFAKSHLVAGRPSGTSVGNAYFGVSDLSDNFAGISIETTNPSGTLVGGYNLTGTSKVDGHTKTWPATNGTVSHGAGPLSGTSTSDATIQNHTHAVEAYDNPGTTANRLIKTGVSGLVSLAAASISGAISAASASISGTIAAATATITGMISAGSAVITGSLDAASASISGLLTVGSFKIGTTTYTAGLAGVTGNIAMGAGSVGVGTSNSTTVGNHTHAVATSTSGAASTIVATNASSDIAARRGLFSQGSQLNYGTSYPSSPVAGLQYLRTDKQSLMFNTGARWESVNPIPVEFGLDLRYVGALNPASFSSTATAVAVGHVLSNLGNVEFQTNSHFSITNNGANDDASNYWNVYVAFGNNDGGSLLTTYLGDPVETNATALKTAGNTAGVAVSKSLASAVTLNTSTNGGKAQVMVEKIGNPTSTLTIRGAVFYKYIN
jgi:hypothetical protein